MQALGCGILSCTSQHTELYLYAFRANLTQDGYIQNFRMYFGQVSFLLDAKNQIPALRQCCFLPDHKHLLDSRSEAMEVVVEQAMFCKVFFAQETHQCKVSVHLGYPNPSQHWPLESRTTSRLNSHQIGKEQLLEKKRCTLDNLSYHLKSGLREFFFNFTSRRYSTSPLFSLIVDDERAPYA